MGRGIVGVGLILVACSLGTGLATEVRAELEAAPPGVSVEDIVRRAEDALRGDRSYCKCEMTVSSPRLAKPRTVAFESWSDGPGKRSFRCKKRRSWRRGTRRYSWSAFVF